MRQPFLHDAVVVLRAPGQVWSRPDGSMEHTADGVHVGDTRVLVGHAVQVAGSELEHVATVPQDADRVRFTALLRGLDGPGADPRVRLDLQRTARADGAEEVLTIRSARETPVAVDLLLSLRPDLTPMALVKQGGTAAPPAVSIEGTRARWRADAVAAVLEADAPVEVVDGVVRIRWRAAVPPHGSASLGWRIRATDRAAVVVAPRAAVPLTAAATGVHALDAWTDRALADLEALQLTLPDSPDDVFLAAGAPWFLTLFGRDAIWAARLLLPIDLRPARGTLRTLARLQGAAVDDRTAERPGGMLHELRREDNALADGTVLPPRYYGTIDATPLWVLLLHDAWRAGLPDDDVRDLLPALQAALGWLRAAMPTDGFLAYLDSGSGLANQGWKDSGDSIRWADGRLAVAPIALCEVQGYAHEAALAAVVLLRAFGQEAEADRWAAWAADLQARFRRDFWTPAGHPAVALDGHGRAVDSLTSNIGHLLGTGILDAGEERRVADLLVDPRLDSGLGLRTLAEGSGGYWPLSYHGGSVWAHDTAIAIRGLVGAGYPERARRLAAGLLTAATAFGNRMPELHSGEAGAAVPYPAACRPQAWSAAAAVAAREALAPVDPVPRPDQTPITRSAG